MTSSNIFVGCNVRPEYIDIVGWHVLPLIPPPLAFWSLPRIQSFPGSDDFPWPLRFTVQSGKTYRHLNEFTTPSQGKSLGMLAIEFF